MKNSVCLIRPENFMEEVASEKKPVLLLCMPYDEEFHAQVKIIEDIAHRYQKALKVGLLEEAFLETFKKNLGIHGTPTFLIMVQGKEQNRMLGLADQDSLQDFIFSSHKQAINNI